VRNCFFCGEDSRVIITRQIRQRLPERIIKICDKCHFNYTYDWAKEDLVNDGQLVEFFKSLETNQKKFSVIILTYNNREITKKCLLSLSRIINQFELIVVDNGSTDGLADFLANVKASVNHPNLKIILNKTNEGVARGRNIGAMNAEADYLVFIDNDAIILKTTDLNQITYPLDNGFCNAGLWQGIYDTNTKQRFHYVLGCFMAYRRDVFEKLQGFDGVWGLCHCDDVDLCYKAMQETGEPSVVVENKGVYHIGGKTTMEAVQYEISRKLLDKNMAILNDRWVKTLNEHELTCMNGVINFNKPFNGGA
jgi:glycosyltransferase involved in cell wall biosynthesis